MEEIKKIEHLDVMTTVSFTKVAYKINELVDTVNLLIEKWERYEYDIKKLIMERRGPGIHGPGR